MRSTDTRSGMTLVEVMTALAVFAIVVMAFASGFNRLLEAHQINEREARVRRMLASHLDELPQRRLVPGRTVLTEGGTGEVSCEMEVEPLTLRDNRERPLPQMYRVRIVARWKEGTAVEERDAEVYVHQP